METHYDATAEYHEVHVRDAWDRLNDVVREAFSGVRAEGVIVDVGAGSGVGTAVLAAVTDAEIIALEPNPTMRAMLMARLDNAGVLERVTVVPEPVPEGLEGLPEKVDGVVAAHMLGHLTTKEREVLLSWIASSLLPGRSALLTVGTDAPFEKSEPIVQERAVGRHTYRVTHHMPGPGRYEGVFEVLDEQGRVVRSVPDAISWATVTAGDVRSALSDHPFEITGPLPGIALVSRVST